MGLAVLIVDTRAGSCDLIAPLRAAGLPVQEGVLDFGDLAFMGRGVRGADVFIGIEHKKLPDLIQSLTSDRLTGHQLPGLLAAYDRAYLVIEGEWDDVNGRITMPSAFRRRSTPVKGAPNAIVLEQRVITLETRGGLRVRWTPNQRASVRHLTALYRFWTDRALDAHKSHLAIHAPDLDPKLREPISDFRKGLNGAVPGIGLALSRALEEVAFDPDKGEGSWQRLLALDVADLAAVSVVDDRGIARKLGPARAARIQERLR